MKDISVNYVAFIAIFAIVTAILCVQKGHSTQDILAYFAFVIVVFVTVHRR